MHRETQLLDLLEYAIDTEDHDKADLIRAELSQIADERDERRLARGWPPASRYAAIAA